MNKFTKISAVALFALFLTACDKAAEKVEAKAEAAATEVKQEAAKVAEEVKSEAQAPSEQGAADYKKFQEWQHAQEQELNKVMTETMEKLQQEKVDEKVAQEKLAQAVIAQFDAIKQSAAMLDVKDAEVKALKEKTLEVMDLGIQLVAESAKIQANPTPEAQQAMVDLNAKLQEVAKQGQAIEAELVKKYAPAPAQEAAPQAK